jgi:hypothetical protein
MEARLTYANARLPQAMLLAGEALDRQDLIDYGLSSLTWLMDRQLAPSGCFSPVGTGGADRTDFGTVQYDQQPVEAWSGLSACITASRYAYTEQFLQRAECCFDWFLGRNVLGVPLASMSTGACNDGLQLTGTNRNQGAESTLSYLCAYAELMQARSTEEPLARTHAKSPSRIAHPF